jgi:hypothetical protein
MSRGFALPIVLVLALVTGILAAVVLERQSYQRRAVSRQLAAYQDTHFERGVREVVSQWTDTLTGQPIEKLLDEDGHALDIERPDGSVVSIYLFDGQGTALSEPSGLVEQDVKDAAGVLERLTERLGRRRLLESGAEFVRPVGPARVCAASAPREVLEAIASYAKGGKSGTRFADSLMDARKDDDVSEADLNTAFSAGDLSTEERAIAKRLLVVSPELWNTVVDVYVPGAVGGGLVARYGGRFLMQNAATGNWKNSTVVSLGKFLSWEALPVGDEGMN